MSVILDVLLIVIFAAIVYSAAKVGFVRSLLELLAVAAALFLSFQLSPVIAHSVYDSYFDEKIVTAIEEQTDGNFDASAVADKVEITISAMPEELVSVAKSVGVDTGKIKKQIAAQEFSADNIAEELTEKVAEPIVTGALTAVIFAVLAIILLIVLNIIADLIAKLFNIPLVGPVNKLLGAALGAVRGVLVIVLLGTILQFAFGGGEGTFAEMVNDSKVIAALDYINPFIHSLKDILK